MTAQTLDLARQIATQVSDLTGRRLPQPRTVNGLVGSLAKLPEKLARNLAPCYVQVRRAARCLRQGNEPEAVTCLQDALAVLTPELVAGPRDLALEIRDKVGDLTGYRLPVPRRASGLYHSFKAIPLRGLDAPLADTLKACRALLCPPSTLPHAIDFSPPLQEVLTMLAKHETK